MRRLIFEEISSRLSTIDNNFNIHRGKWSEFEFNFSEAPLFYKLDNLTFEESNIYKFKLFDYINFDNSVFINGLNFPVNLKIDASFKNATFCEETDFQYANFYNTANFSNAKFLKKADFEGARFGTIAIDPDNDATESSILQLLIQLNPINFKNADFYGEAIFYNARFSKMHILMAQNLEIRLTLWIHSLEQTWYLIMQSSRDIRVSEILDPA